MYDIVYVLKPQLSTQEFRYSLRSVCKNFPHRKVWVVGGVPRWFKGKRIHYIPPKRTKWWNVNQLLMRACQNPNITKNFYLFNDDFFVIKPVKDFQNLYNGDLQSLIDKLIKDRENASRYTVSLKRANQVLKRSNKTTLNYELHAPMLINRNDLLRVIRRNPQTAARRSLYGNIYSIGGVQRKDYKVYSTTQSIPNAQYISTTDDTFKNGKVGKEIRETFSEKCKYE